MANKIIPNASFHHVALSSACFEKSLEFYKALGFEEKYRWGEGDGRAVMLDMGDGGIIEIFANGKGTPETNAGFIHFAINTTDTNKAFDIALKNGATPQREPNDCLIPAVPAPIAARIAFVYGPAGELIEFFQIREEK